MKCESLQFNLPLYIDDVLSAEDRLSIERHLPACPLCRHKLDEYRGLRNELRMTASPVLPVNLLDSVRNSVACRIGEPTILTGPAPAKSFWEVINYWLMPYSVGTAAALLFTVALLAGLGSTKNAADSLAGDAASEQPVLLANSNIDQFNQELSLGTDYTEIAVAGNTPEVNPAGALFALTKSIVRGEMKDEEVVVVAEVFGNGLAKISEVVEPPNNARSMRELEKAFQTDPDKAPFLPLKFEQNSKAVRVVFKIQRVDVEN